ncbi:MAG: energy-coupled thiamine transporter ThiT [Oscillospiraceae bacterium]|nr:energy-coupled thiamine transporter ThiT [Oscillospiraceae bacterium]
MKSEKNITVAVLAECAVMLGLATVLSFVKIIPMPMGGSVTLLSMLPIVLISIRHGAKTGLLAAGAYSLIQFAADAGMLFGWALTPAALIGTVTLDYLLAYTGLGLAGAFVNKGGPVAGALAGTAAVTGFRFLCHFISGIIIFGQWAPDGWNPVLYSLCYNGLYMLPELIFTVAGAAALLKAPYVSKMFVRR